MIRFQNQQVRASQMESDRVRNVAQIRDQTYFYALRLERESHWVDGVVRNRKTAHIDIANREARARAKTIQLRRMVRPGNGIGGEPRGEYRDIVELFGQRH